MGELQESSLRPQPLSYGLPGPLRIQRRRRIVGISSVVVGALALLLSGVSFFGSLDGMSQARRDMAANKHVEMLSSVPGPLEEPKDSYTDDFYACFILGALVLLAIMLLVGAVMLLRSDRRGLVLHWIYIPFQILANIALTADVMSIFDHTFPMKSFAYLGAVPGLIGCVYPLILLWFLFAGVFED